MARRSVAWRRLCPDELNRCFDEVARITLYIVNQTGPTGFILKEDGTRKKFKVFLGDPHMCTCPTFKKTREVCVHILWVLLKKFRVPRSNPVIWQLGLIEREINEILHGHLIRQSPTPSKGHAPSSQQVQIPQREIGPDDVCPICQDDLLGSGRQITYCRFGCGKSVHIKCMKIWSDHQKSTGEKTLRCPLCREDFGSILNPAKPRGSHLPGLEQQYRHLGVWCSHCHVCPVVGRCYKCCFCVSFYLCHACFSNQQVHLNHPFQFRQQSSHPWRAVSRPSFSSSSAPSLSPLDTILPTALVTALQSRSLSESDYELLLHLDDPHARHLTPLPQGVSQRSQPPRAESLITSLHVEPLDGHHPLIVGGACCHICQQAYIRGEWIKKLPCKHKFHRGCIDSWLHSAHTTCPVDGQPICIPSHRTRSNRRRPPPVPNPPEDSLSSLGIGYRRAVAPLTRARLLGSEGGMAVRSRDCYTPDISIWGRGIKGELGSTHGEVPVPLESKFSSWKRRARKSDGTSLLLPRINASLGATPTNLTGTGVIARQLQLNPLLTSTSIVAVPHLTNGSAPSLDYCTQPRGQRSICGMGVARKFSGRLRNGLIAGRGANVGSKNDTSIELNAVDASLLRVSRALPKAPHTVLSPSLI